MPEIGSRKVLSIPQLIFVPALISLLVTLLRLMGELQDWPGRWFSKETGGSMPQGLSWVVGITWLAIPFGIYFAYRLVSSGHTLPSIAKASLCAGAGFLILLGFRYLGAWIPLEFPASLIVIWLVWAAAGLIQYFGWPELFRTLFWYGLAARIPVAVVMFFAMLGNWGTHYDYVGMPPEFNMSLLPRFLWLAFFPQLVAWVAFTVTIGSVAGVLTAVALKLSGRRGKHGMA